jgi:hypothetical protein
MAVEQAHLILQVVQPHEANSVELATMQSGEENSFDEVSGVR